MRSIVLTALISGTLANHARILAGESINVAADQVSSALAAALVQS
jgi:hypothetical protein